jgi:GNAT superfamily N-acetyltransferase
MTKPLAAFEIRCADDWEARACRLLMPDLFSAVYAPELWVAYDRASAQLAGAGAVGWQPVPPQAGFPVYVHVIASQRRRGIGTALMHAIAGVCKGNTRCLHSWMSETEGSAAACFLVSAGFAPRQRVFDFDAEGTSFYAMIKSIHDRLLTSGRIPPDLKIVSLREAPRAQVIALVAKEFEDIPLSTVMALSKGLINYDADKSSVLLRGGEVKGALLYMWNNGRPVIDVRVVAPDCRRGPGNVMLLEASTRKGLQAGATGFRFSCEEHVRDTVSLARRSGAKQANVRVAFTRTLEAA